MKKRFNQTKGFTIAELLIAIAILIVITGLTIPVAKKILPDSDRETIKHVYYQLGSTIQSMTNDPYVYPTGRFDSPRDYVNQQNGTTYNKTEKFTKFFTSRFNVAELQELGVEEAWVDDSVTNTPDVNLNSILGYSDKDSTLARVLENDPQTRTCFLTNNRIYYCIPSITFIDYAEGEAITDSLKALHDRFHKDGNIVISVFLTNKHLSENGYFFTLSKEGKIGLLPTDDITSIIPKSKFCSKSDTEIPTCADDCMYDNVNQCKLYEYLSKTK